MPIVTVARGEIILEGTSRETSEAAAQHEEAKNAPDAQAPACFRPRFSSSRPVAAAHSRCLFCVPLNSRLAFSLPARASRKIGCLLKGKTKGVVQ